MKKKHAQPVRRITQYPVSLDEYCQTNNIRGISRALLEQHSQAKRIKTANEWQKLLETILKTPA